MLFANRPTARRMRGEHSADERCATRDATDWLRDYLSNRTAKDIADATGSSVRAAENIKQGRNGMTMAHIISMCRADPYFRAEFFRFAGGELEADPQMVGALSHAINAVMQKRRDAE